MGVVRMPGSKAVTQRLLMLAALAQGTTHIRAPLVAEDTLVLREALCVLGIPIRDSEDGWEVEGKTRFQGGVKIDLGASGASLRFLLPCLAIHASGPVSVEGDARLFQRPLTSLLAVLTRLGARWETTDSGGVMIPGKPITKLFEEYIDASETSQFLSGLAMAAASLPAGAHLRWEGVPTSYSYLRLTSHWMARFGCAQAPGEGIWEVPGNRLKGIEAIVCGDWSAAAVFLCAAVLTGRSLELLGLDAEDPQGDRTLLEILQAAGGVVSWSGSNLRIEGKITKGIEVDLRDTPDLAPVLCATAALAPSPSVLRGLGALKGKECDRLEASMDLVRWLGGEVRLHGDSTLDITPGKPQAARAAFNPLGDHRMAFAAALGGLRWGGELHNPKCVSKSFPGFWQAWLGMLSVANTK